MSPSHPPLPTGVARIVVAYAAFAALWVLLSDRVMGWLIGDPGTLVLVSMAKGWLFVAVTTALLYGLVSRFARALVDAHQRELAFERERDQPPAMLKAIADASTDAIFAKDEDGRYTLVNHAAAQAAGREAAQMLGQDNRALFPSPQADHLMEVDRQVRLSGQEVTSEETIPTAQGPRIFLTTKGPLRGSDGQVFGTYGIARDITERKQAELALQQLADDLAATLQAIPDLMFEVDAGGRYIKVKALNETLLAAPPEQLLGRSVADVLPPAAAATVMQALAAAQVAGTDFGRRMELPLPTGRHHFELSVARKPVAAGQDARFIVLSRDVTAREAAENELRQRNEELERFNRAATDRELRMVALKHEVNELAIAAGLPARYDVAFAGLRADAQARPPLP